MEQNPYAPPKAVVSDVDASGASASGFPVPGGLYTSGQHFVAAFLGSPIAAALIAAANYRKLRRDRDARNVVLWGVVATAALIAVAYMLPDGFPSYVLPLVYSFGARFFADARFGAALKAHHDAGGKPASWWRLIGISLLSLLAIGVAIFVGALALSYFGFVE